ncbi:MAG: glycosyltransferase family 4 protein [Deltaproteobacteria bacterium]|jgi:glycosyltransferase involved in cell wall biosynthesis|nr:glycosyltransferase family 4 protein [Deltaproteobacteria bacterium]
MPGIQVIGNVASDSPKKGVGRLLAAYAAARRSLPPSTLVVVGVNNLEQWRSVCAGLGIEEHVRLVPRIENVADYLQTFALLVFTSYFIESQPNVIMEAMSLGVPVIASNIGEISSMLLPDCLFRPGDADEAARLLVSVANDPERLSLLSALNLAWKPLFSMERRLETVLGHYRAALREAGLPERKVR